MPWRYKTVNQIREEFVRRVLSNEKSKSALCREYGISRPTADKWIKRYLSGEPLDNRSKYISNTLQAFCKRQSK